MTTLSAYDPATEVVTAPAGSGKTTLLIWHFLRHLRAGTPIERIVAITFTRKAAAELVQRLAKVLAAVADPKSCDADAWKTIERLYGDVLPPAQQALAALAALDAAPVMTVDAFCLSLVQEFVLDACFVLDDGERVYVDGPLVSGGDGSDHFAAAARQELEKLGKHANVLLAELTFGQAIDAVGQLAAIGPVASPTLSGALAAIGKELAPVVKQDPAAWLEAAAKAEDFPGMGDWLKSPKGAPPVSVFSLLTTAKAAKLGGDSVVIRALATLGWSTGIGLSRVGPSLSARLDRWIDQDACGRNDDTRAALIALAGRARSSAWRELARSPALGYDHVLTLATNLCTSPPTRLVERYDVLLVDELQDTNPAQLAFYQAFAGMRRGARRIRKFLVGDARQSIYRFRHADPQGWQTLVEDANMAKTHAELTINYRSSKVLVEAQRVLFGRVAEQFPGALDPLDKLSPDPDAHQGDDDGPPVQVVDGHQLDDCSEHVLAAFAERVRSRWAEAASARESAAVLVCSWAVGAWAVETLRAYDIKAQLTGDRALLASRPAADLRLFLGLLVEPSDELGAAAVLKHPALGMTDRGLLLARKAGLLGRLLAPDLDLSPLGPEAEALAPALEVLRRARARIGRQPTADVLEHLVADLHLRPLVSAGPEGQAAGDVGLAQLDILLEVVRSHESDGVDPRAVLEALVPDPDNRAEDLPVVRMHQSHKVVTVTTVYGAKGLEYDHVALLDVGHKGSDGRQEGKAFTVYRPQGKPMLALRIDPTGGIDPVLDPLSVLALVAGGDEAVKEGMRLFYVGFTRARRSVVFGVSKGDQKKTNTQAKLRQILDERDIAGVVRRSPDDIELRARPPLVRKRTGCVGDFEAQWTEPDGWALARPSSAAETGADPCKVVADFRARARVVVAPPGPPLPTGKALQDVPEITWGSVVHGWLERWAFEGTPKVGEAGAYLRTEWSSEDKAVAAWLVALGLHLRDQLPGFAGLLAQAKELHFEWPMVGVDEKTIWRGRTDLVVELSGRKAVIIDFKAGSRVARSASDIPNVEEYAPQLEAYRRMLEAGGYQVTEVGLLYVRGPNWVRVG